MEHRLARLTTEEILELKWFMGGLLALLSLWALWPLDLAIHGAVVPGFLAVCGALAKPGWVAAIPRAAWKVTPFVLFALVGLDFVLSVPEFLGPLVRMVALLLVYRALSQRRRREDLQLVLLCLFCLVISGVLTVSLLFALQILLFTPLAMAQLFLICISRHEEADLGAEARFSSAGLRQLLRRVREVLDFRVVALGAGMFVLVVGLSTLLFVLTPRFNLEQALPMMQINTTGRSGFNESVRIGEVTEITRDNSVALRVDVPSRDAVQSSPYWRMLVLDKYDNGAFRVSHHLESRDFRSYESLREIDDWGVPANGRPGESWTFYLEGRTSRFLPIPGAFDRMRFQSRQDVLLMEDMNVVGTDSVRQSVFFYQLRGLEWLEQFPASRRERDFFENGELGRRELPTGTAYPATTLELDLDEADKDYLDNLNEEFLEGGEKVAAPEYGRRVTGHLRSRFQYSLSPRVPAGADPFVAWLREGERGHCELFAGSLVLLAREAGYPARMVVGFAGGSWNSVEEYFVIRNSNAHAWVELYDAGSGDWVRVDPTPGQGSGGSGSRAASGGRNIDVGWNAWLDSLRIQWYRRVVNFDEHDQAGMADALGSWWEETKATLRSGLENTAVTLKRWILQPLEWGFFPTIGWLLLVSLAGAILWRRRDSWLTLVRRFFRRPGGMDPVRKQAGRYLRKVSAGFSEDPASADPSNPGELKAVKSQLEALRFGPRVRHDQARPVFHRARRALANRRKRPARFHDF